MGRLRQPHCCAFIFVVALNLSCILNAVDCKKDWNLKEVSVAESPVLTIWENETLPTKEDCTTSHCFDVFKCNVLAKDISVFVYPITQFTDSNQLRVSSSHSLEFQELLDAIVKSKYYTSNPEEVCVFVPSIDLLTQTSLDLETTSQMLNSLHFWKNEGSNHLLFNMIAGSFPDYSRRLQVNTGKAIIAGGGFDSWTYRPGFDVSIPVFSPLSTSFTRRTKSKKLRLLSATQYDGVSNVDKSILETLASQHPSDMIVVSHRCHSNTSRNITGRSSREMCDTLGKPVSYPEVLTESTFCLLLPTAYMSSPTLSDILMTSCVPVIAVDEVVLPFPEKIDWTRASVRLREFLLPSVIDILAGIPEKTRHEMRGYGQFVYQSYFSSTKAIALTTLDILNERIIPGSVNQDKTRMLSCTPTNEV